MEVVPKMGNAIDSHDENEHELSGLNGLTRRRKMEGGASCQGDDNCHINTFRRKTLTLSVYQVPVALCATVVNLTVGI